MNRFTWDDSSIQVVKYIVEGRSIDGTVYASGLESWTSERKHAQRFANHEQAQRVIDKRIVRNRACDPDMVIGRLRIVEVSK